MSKSEPVVRLTRAQVREIDRRATEEYHIPGIVLMESAALYAFSAAMYMLLGKPRSVVNIAVGSGNNGGDGLAIARHLHNEGHDVRLVLVASPADFSGDAAINWRISQAMRLKVLDETPTNFSDLWIDAIFGTGLTRPPTGRAAELIDVMNRSAQQILAVDVPSGMDCDSGEPLGWCVMAARTITFVAEKVGFANPKAKAYTGSVTVGAIGCPRELIDVVRREVQ